MNYIKELSNKITDIFNKLGYKTDLVELKISDRKDLGDYQINDCMPLASTYHKSPRDIASEVVTELEKDNSFTNINIAGPGFINVTLSDEYLIDTINKIINDKNLLIEKLPKKKVLIDYGGANVAKALHVGHLRSANIGEALKRLATLLGNEVLGDAHLGDYGRPLGLVIRELKERYPDSKYFNDYNGEDDINITNKDLEELYPIASQKAKADEKYLNEAREINNKIQNKEKGYFELYKKIVEISKEETKTVYDNINTNFEIWNGESDSLKYLDELNKIVEDKKVLRESEGAKVIDVAEDTDKIEIPPLLYIKSDGTISYETTDLTTILQRKKEFAPDEEIYITDFRQTLHFTQVFRAAKKLGLVSDGELSFYAFGTMNGTDGKPFKTRDGGVLQLKKLLELVYNETIKRIDFTKMEEDEGKEIAKTVAIAAIKYADLVPFRGTDYIFDIEKFTDIEGKTGPYILYSNIRMKSLLSKANDITIDNIYTIHKDLREIYLLVLNLANILINSYEQKSLNDITDYLYNICSLFNSFYAKNNVLKEENIDLKKSYLATINLVYYITNLLLDTLAIKIPEKM